MPLVFKGRRNILRSANKSKREHFTQNSINRDAFRIKLTNDPKQKLFNIKLSARTGYWYERVLPRRYTDDERITTIILAPDSDPGEPTTEKTASGIIITKNTVKSDYIIDNKIILPEGDLAFRDYFQLYSWVDRDSIGLKQETEKISPYEPHRRYVYKENRVQLQNNKMKIQIITENYIPYLKVSGSLKAEDLGVQAVKGKKYLKWSTADVEQGYNWEDTTGTSVHRFPDEQSGLPSIYCNDCTETHKKDEFILFSSKIRLPVTDVTLDLDDKGFKISSYGRLIEYFDKYDKFLGENDRIYKISTDEIPIFQSDVKYIRASSIQDDLPVLSKPVIYRLNKDLTLTLITQSDVDHAVANEDVDINTRGLDLNPPVIMESGETLGDFYDRLVAAENKKVDLRNRGNKMDPPVTRGSDETRGDFERRLLDDQEYDLVARNTASNLGVTKLSNETLARFAARVERAEDKLQDFIDEGNSLIPAVTRWPGETLAAFGDRVAEEKALKEDLERRAKALNPPLTRGSDETRNKFEKKVVDMEARRDDIVRRGGALNPPVIRKSDETKEAFGFQEALDDFEKEAFGSQETLDEFEKRVEDAEEEEKDLVARNGRLKSPLTRGSDETRNSFESRLSLAEKKELQTKSEEEAKRKAIDTENQGLKNLLVYIQQTINSILKEVGQIKGIDVEDPWCSGYFRRDNNTCCSSYDEVHCKYKHPAIGMANILFIGIIVLMLGAITYRLYKIIKHIF